MDDFRYEELEIKEVICMYGFRVCIGGCIKKYQILMALNILEDP